MRSTIVRPWVPLLLVSLGVIALLGCDDDVAYSSTSTVDADLSDLGGGSDALGQDTSPLDTSSRDTNVLADTPELGEDAALEGPYCQFSILGVEGASLASCDISVRSMTACDDMVRCICQYYLATYPQGELFPLEDCVRDLTAPRGAITLADYCPQSGAGPDVPSLRDVVEMFGVPTIGLLSQGESFQASPECSAVAAFTLWGEPPAWSMSLGQPDMPFPNDTWRVEEFPLETPPLITINDIKSLSASESLLLLNDQGRDRIQDRLDGARTELLGREFLIYTTSLQLARGLVMSIVISSTRTGLVVILEQIEEGGFGAVRFWDGYPPGDPYPVFPPALAARHLQLDAACISTCGCPDGRTCGERGVCTELPMGQCLNDDDCCFGQCEAGACR